MQFSLNNIDPVSVEYIESTSTYKVTYDLFECRLDWKIAIGKAFCRRFANAAYEISGNHVICICAG